MSKELNGKNITCIIIDEPTQIKPKPKVSINPTRESSWLKEFEKWLKDNEYETEI